MSAATLVLGVHACLASPHPTPAPGFAGADPPPRVPLAETWDVFGELRGRAERLSPFVLDDTGLKNPQTAWLATRLRAGGAWSPWSPLRLVLEGEALSGTAAGDLTALGTAASDDAFLSRRDERFGQTELRARQAYLRVDTPIGRFTVGQQAFLWGTGMLAHDGVAPSDFGEAWGGNLVERVAFATQPAPGFTVFMAGDVVFADDNARLMDGDEAYGGALGVRHEVAGRGAMGLLVALREQTDRADPRRPDGRRPTLSVMTGDVWAKWSLGAVTLEGEGAVISGRTTRPYTEETARSGAGVRSFGALLRARHDQTPWRLTTKLEAGFAGGDDDPRDAMVHTFSFNRDYNVGLVLFEHYLPLVTARAADRATDPALLAVAPSGLRYTVNQGAVSNAAYLFPRALWRPVESVDLRLGYLVAWAPADLVDVYQSGIAGGHNTSPGGHAPGGRLLGQEVDFGARWTYPVFATLELRLGGEAGIFLPGSAFAGLGDSPVTTLRGAVEVAW